MAGLRALPPGDHSWADPAIGKAQRYESQQDTATWRRPVVGACFARPRTWSLLWRARHGHHDRYCYPRWPSAEPRLHAGHQREHRLRAGDRAAGGGRLGSRRRRGCLRRWRPFRHRAHAGPRPDLHGRSGAGSVDMGDGRGWLRGRWGVPARTTKIAQGVIVVLERVPKSGNRFSDQNARQTKNQSGDPTPSDRNTLLGSKGGFRAPCGWNRPRPPLSEPPRARCRGSPPPPRRRCAPARTPGSRRPRR